MTTSGWRVTCARRSFLRSSSKRFSRAGGPPVSRSCRRASARRGDSRLESRPAWGFRIRRRRTMAEAARAGGHIPGFAATTRTDRWWVGALLTAVGPLPRRRYRGETGLLVVQNLHRYALYFAIAFIFILYYDAYRAFFRDGQFGVGAGSVILLINPTLLAGYTFGCHSWRHLVGGGLDCFSCDRARAVRHGAWRGSSALNAHHMQWAWVSLFWVAFSDIYVRLASMGVLHDLSTWG